MTDSLRERIAETIADLRFGDCTSGYIADALLAPDGPVGQLVAALEELAVIGDETWKTPGHPMNAWVSKSRVQCAARAALGRDET